MRARGGRLHVAVFLPLVVLVLGLVAWIAWSAFATDSNAREPGGEQDRPHAVSTVTVDVAEPTAATALAPGAPRSARTAPETAALRGRVVDESGAPVQGATASWTSLEGAEVRLDPFDPAREELERASLLTTTDADGTFSFDEAPAGVDAARSTLWVTHPERLAQHALLEAGEHDPQLIEMPAAEPIRARVVDPSDTPLAGVLVRQLVHFPLADDIEVDARTLLALQAFQRTWTSDADGHVALPPLPQLQSATAGERAKQSRPWIGRHPAEPVLVLGEMFVARGTVRTDGAELDLGELRIVALDVGSSGLAILGRAPVAADGSWGPVAWPVPHGHAVELTLKGGAVAAATTERPAPAAGEELVVDFVARVGLGLPIRVIDAGGEPLASARTEVLWQQDGAWCRAESRTDAAGLALVRGCAAGYLWVRGDRSGYVSRTLDPVHYTAAPAEPVEVRLVAAGTIAGRVLVDGAPAPDFTVLVWGGDLQNRTSHDFTSRVDGTFEIDEAPLGRVHVQTFTPRAPPCEPVVVQVDAGEPAHVELALEAAIVGRGRVVDLITGEGLADATVQVCAAWGSEVVSAWGPPHPVRADGSFEIEGFTGGHNVFIVSAAGHADRYDIVDGANRAELDLGVLAMTPSQELRVRTTDPSAAAEFTAWTAQAILDGWSSEARPLDERGEVRFPGVPPGRVCVRLTSASGAADTTFELRAGERWIVDVVLPDATGPALQVDVVAAEPVSEAAPPAFTLRLDTVLAGGEVRTGWGSGAPGERAEIAGPFGPEALVKALDARTFDVVGVARVLAPAERSSPVRLQVGARRRTVRVVDADGDLLSGTHVYLLSLESDSRLHVYAVTGEDGTCRLHVPPLERARAYLLHQTVGQVVDLIIDLPDDPSEVIELELDAPVTAVITFLDGSEPVQGVVAGVAAFPGVPANLITTPSDPAGRSTLGPTRPGTYWLAPQSPGIWPSEHTIELREPSSSVTLQVRRRGSLELAARDASGAALAGLALELVSDELGESVASWVARDLVQSSSAALTTDATGRLLLVGLPRGSYTWRATLADGTPLTGTTVVPPGATGHAAIELP